MSRPADNDCKSPYYWQSSEKIGFTVMPCALVIYWLTLIDWCCIWKKKKHKTSAADSNKFVLLVHLGCSARWFCCSYGGSLTCPGLGWLLADWDRPQLQWFWHLSLLHISLILQASLRVYVLPWWQGAGERKPIQKSIFEAYVSHKLTSCCPKHVMWVVHS